MKFIKSNVATAVAVATTLLLSGCNSLTVASVDAPSTTTSITSPSLDGAPTPVTPDTSESPSSSVIVAPPEETVPSPVVPSDYNFFTGPNYTDKVVLTFDDCPQSVEQLRSVVTTAKANDIGLVLAPIGQCLERFGQNITDIMRENGQYVINHSVSHPALTSLSVDGVVRELSAPGVVTNYGRPPYGDGYFSKPPSATVAAGYAAVGMKPWLWTVDTNDWKGGSADSIVGYVINNSGPGDTVLMHMNHNAFNPASILDMKHGLEQRGLQVCRAYPGGVTPVMLPDSLPC